MVTFRLDSFKNELVQSAGAGHGHASDKQNQCFNSLNKAFF